MAKNVIYSIRPNKKSSSPSFFGIAGFSLFKNKHKFEVTLLEGFDYQDDKNDKFDTCKIYGFSNGLHHLDNSLRLGFNKDSKNNINFMMLVHEEGRIHTKKIIPAKIGVVYEVIMGCNSEEYYIYIREKKEEFIYIARTFDRNIYTKNAWIKLHFAPYLSNNLDINKTIKIAIKKL